MRAKNKAQRAELRLKYTQGLLFVGQRKQIKARPEGPSQVFKKMLVVVDVYTCGLFCVANLNCGLFALWPNGTHTLIVVVNGLTTLTVNDSFVIDNNL